MKRIKLFLIILISGFLFFVHIQTVHAVTVNCVNNCPDLSPGSSSGEWPMVGANLQRTSWNTEEVSGALSVDWYTPITEVRTVHEAEPIISAGKVYIATNKGLIAIDANTGAKVWSYGTDMPLGGNPTVANGVVYVGGYDRRIHAVNVSDGKLKTGWTFVEAGAGFETNPLVVNNKVYIGNRDGYMYCLDANTGALVWKWRDEKPYVTQSDEWPEAPIRFSAAYKNGIIYWGQDNAHAYALRDNGTNGELVWKTVQPLPGVGFTSFWTVFYHDRESNKDYILLSGSKKSPSFGWWDGDYYYKENYDLFSGIPLGGLIGAVGQVEGDWVSGTKTIDASKIQNYINTNPQKRHLLILDAGSGNEYATYAPVSWVSTTHGGDKRPPLINGIDGVIYTHMGYKNGNSTIEHPPDGESPNMGASGGISGWKFGTQYISRLYDFVRGFADETVHFTSGGNIVYWSEGFNMPYGSFSVNKPMGSNSPVNYAPCGGDCLGIPNGGGDSALVPYNNRVYVNNKWEDINRVYMLDGNQLVAFKINGSKTAKPAVLIDNPTTPAANPVSVQMIQARLTTEVNRILTAGGPLRPGFHDSGIWGSAVNGYYPPDIILGDHLSEYFHTPTDTIVTLYQVAQVMPSLKDQIVTYLKTYYGVGKNHDVTALAHVGWKSWPQREIYPDTLELATIMQRSTNDSNSVIASLPRTSYYMPAGLGLPKPFNFPQDAFYGAWKYAQLVPADALAIWNAIKGKIEAPIASATLQDYPYVLNQYINGYTGYVELGKLVGANVASQETALAELKSLRSRFSTANPFEKVFYSQNLLAARNFMYMTPELAGLMKTQNQIPIQAAVDGYKTSKPYWFVTKFDQTHGEGVFEPLHTYHALFQAKARILRQPYEDLVKYIDAPAFWRGDLYYIQNLVAALEVAGTVPTLTPTPTPTPKPGDANGDGQVNTVDFTTWMKNYSSSNSGPLNGDFNSDGKVNGVDLILWLNNYGT